MDEENEAEEDISTLLTYFSKVTTFSKVEMSRFIIDWQIHIFLLEFLSCFTHFSNHEL